MCRVEQCRTTPGAGEVDVDLQHILGYSGVEKSARFRFAFVGQGPTLDVFTRVAERNDFSIAFPRAKIVGWVPTPGALPDKAALRGPGFLLNRPLFADVAGLFSSHPGLHLAVDLSPDSRHMESMRLHAPASVSLCTSEALLRFCAAAEDGRLAVGGGENLRKSQKFFALLVDQMDGDILILDERGIILDLNRHAAETRDLTRAQLIGRPCSDLDIPMRFCRDDEPCPFHEAKNSARVSEQTFSEVMPSGRVRYIQAACFPVTGTLDSSTQYLYIRRDVTERHHLEQRLQQAEKMAAIGELSTYMAHEIRNPLFSIGGFANALLRNPSLNDLAREKARIIYDESRRLDVILSNILNFARPTDQAMGEFDLETVARQTIDLMTIGSAERGITVNLDIEAHLPRASGNAENMKQCLINLVKNALEAMPDGGTLTLRAKQSNSYVRIDVEDTGRGIPTELHEKIFSPFFTTKNSGSGLGLAMTRKIINEMGGKVRLESTEGSGTRITLYVPVALAVEDESLAEASGNHAEASGHAGNADGPGAENAGGGSGPRRQNKKGAA